MRRSFHVSMAAALLAALALAGCGGGGEDGNDTKGPPPTGPQSGEAAVRIVNFEFKPQKVDVKPGTTVTWINDDTTIHDIKDTSPLAIEVSKELGKGETFSITYGQPGSYSYVCGIHPYMTGSVEVVP